ncbi:MAG: flagellar protein [Planctomycetia bacterium]|nr:flagellar protein [Planctomycetia bacterium]
MAKEDDLDLDLDEGAEPAKKSKSKLFIIIGVVVLLLGVSGTATLMMTGMLSGDDEELAAEQSGTDGKAGKNKKGGKEKKVKKVKAPLNYVPLDPPFVVNFTADTDIRFLQITLEVGTRKPEVVELVKEHRPAIRNALVMLFGSQDPYALGSREGKEKLRAETLSEIQNVMKEETGEPGVEKVFFTSFVMQ